MAKYPYAVFGPLVVPRDEYGLVTGGAAERREFWDEVDAIADGLSDAIGCYVFSIRAGKGLRPWYVGKTEKRSFSKECFAPPKPNLYNRVLVRMKRGTPVLHLLPRLTRLGRWRKPTMGRVRDVDTLETMLIGMAMGQNRNLLNAQKTQVYHELHVPGLFNSAPGMPTEAVRTLKRSLGR